MLLKKGLLHLLQNFFFTGVTNNVNFQTHATKSKDLKNDHFNILIPYNSNLEWGFFSNCQMKSVLKQKQIKNPLLAQRPPNTNESEKHQKQANTLEGKNKPHS